MTQNVGDIEYVIKADTAQLLRADKQVATVTDNMDAGFKKADNSASKMSMAISKVSAAISVALIVEWGRAFLSAADSMNQLNARIERLTGSAATASQTMQNLMRISSATGGSLQDTAKLWETLSTALRDTGATNGQIIQLTETLQKIGRIGGSSSEEMANALRQFGQSISSGVVRAEEFNSILEQMPELARQIAAGMGVSIGELRQLMLDGKLTAEDALNAIQKQTSSVNAEFDKLPRTLSQANTALTNSFLTMVDDINQATEASNGMVLVIDSLAVAIGRLTGQAATASQQIADLRSEAEMYARRARTWSWLGFGDWQKENEDKSAQLTAEAWEKSSRAGWDAAQKVAKNSKPITIKATIGSAEKTGINKAKAKGSADAAAEAISKQQAALSRLNTGYAEGSLELAQYDAVVALGNKATDEQIAKARSQAKAIWEVTNAIKNRAQAEQAKRFTDQEIAANKTTPDAVTGAVQDPTAQIALQEQQKLAALQQYQQMGVLSVQQYEDAKTAIQEQAANARRKIAVDEANAQTEAIGSILGSASQGFDSLASIIENTSGKSSGAYVAMFAAAKAFAIAQSTLSLNTAIMQAMADPTALTPAQKMANYAAIASAGASLLSNIASVTMSGGRRYGGTVSAGNAYRVNEDGRSEIFQTAGGQQAFIPNQSGKIIPADKVGGGGGVVQHITFEINTTGGIDDATMAKMAQMMKQVSLSTIRDQQRPNGLLRRS
ncbi:tape measure protein [Enterobacter hormaechei]|jgi:tape measure domain-containing protein|uniref:tape measure protein n=1 Tax=Enterobacter hormaechei TaxID=158836 RepID=UPI00125745B8|nr:tape measure protein [Enterobacter hormaechei]MDX7058417.1 tape measure protein [Enterobacter hormaechei]VAF28146.1 phage tape measure protein [Enterobacter hormaechei]HDX4947892.1 tape measure protein [Enterobacter hormaechei subsp. steigerwaltii]